MYDNIKSLIEQRVVRARDRSVTAKLLCVAENLGTEIIGHEDRETFLPDPWELPDQEDEDLPVAEDWGQESAGYYFDGLKCGINLAVKALLYDGQLSEVKASHNGYVVYHEESGSLKAYAPYAAWEDAVEMFYEAAKRTEMRKARAEQKRVAEVQKRRTAGLLSRLRSLWGDF